VPQLRVVPKGVVEGEDGTTGEAEDDLDPLFEQGLADRAAAGQAHGASLQKKSRPSGRTGDLSTGPISGAQSGV